MPREHMTCSCGRAIDVTTPRIAWPDLGPHGAVMWHCPCGSTLTAASREGMARARREYVEACRAIDLRRARVWRDVPLIDETKPSRRELVGEVPR